MTSAAKILYWTITRSMFATMTSDEYDAYVASATPIADRPMDAGVIVLRNGARREARWITGAFTGKRVLQYRTPAGNWRNPYPDEAATFTPDPFEAVRS